MGRPGRPQQIDRDALHQVLWKRTDRHGRIRLVNQKVAEDLSISPYHFSRIMQEGVRDGRWSVLLVGKHSIRTYQIVDPDVWAQGPQAGIAAHG